MYLRSIVSMYLGIAAVFAFVKLEIGWFFFSELFWLKSSACFEDNLKWRVTCHPFLPGKDTFHFLIFPKFIGPADDRTYFMPSCHILRRWVNLLRRTIVVSENISQKLDKMSSANYPKDTVFSSRLKTLMLLPMILKIILIL